MADSFELDMAELNTIQVALDVGSLAALRKGSEVVRSTAQRIVATAQQLVPVDTSTTKNSIHASAAGGAPMASGTLDVEIGPTTSYAPHLEYGTIHMAPYAFMGPALDRETPGFVEAVSQIPGLGL